MTIPKEKVLILAAKKFEDTELLYPYYRLLEAGFDVDIAAAEVGKVKGKHEYKVMANRTLADARDHGACGYRGLVIPGGKAPAKLRGIPEAVDIVRDFMGTGAPVAAICHGPQLLVTAGVLEGRHVTCYSEVAPEVEAVGAKYEDVEVVVDDNLVTSRMPCDLPAFMREFMKKLA